MRTLSKRARSTTVSLCAQTNRPTYTVSGSDTPASSLRDERVAEPRDGHDVGAAAPLELELHVARRDAVARLHLLRHRAGRAAELEREHPVAVRGRRDVRARSARARADRPAHLAVRLHAAAHEPCARREDEVARHPPPDEVEVVAVGPHVRAGAGDAYVSVRGIERDSAGAAAGADVGLALEDAELGVGDRRNQGEGDCERAKRGGHRNLAWKRHGNRRAPWTVRRLQGRARRSEGEGRRFER